MEKWERIKGYEKYYEISNFGNVKSLDREISNKKGSYTKKGRLLKKSYTSTGYLKVELTKNKKKKSFKVHRLVAQAFIPNPESKPNVNHIDGNPLNNNFKNLEWCTQKENVEHALKLGLIEKKLTPEQESELIKMYVSRVSGNELSRKFNISKTAIYIILRRNSIDVRKIKESMTKYNIDINKLKNDLKSKKQIEIAKMYGCHPSLISCYAKKIKKEERNKNG